ncbi:MAG: flavodoxin family protein [candidate division Zixibacteria bacterium]|nr:flavodoxin family protein [candidate division Zixibacteria bacterium]
MIRILAISASPVPDSSTDLILRRLMESVVAGVANQAKVETAFVRLNELTFIPCQACGKAPTPEVCFFDDDLTESYRQLTECNCLLFGSPVYFDSVSAQAKMFIDRCNCFRPPDFDNVNGGHGFIRTLKRKRPGAMVIVGGERGWLEGARRVIAGFFKWVEVTNEGLIEYRSPDYTKSGSVRDDEEIMLKTDNLGQKLAELVVVGGEHLTNTSNRV